MQSTCCNTAHAPPPPSTPPSSLTPSAVELCFQTDSTFLFLSLTIALKMSTSHWSNFRLSLKQDQWIVQTFKTLN